MARPGCLRAAAVSTNPKRRAEIQMKRILVMMVASIFAVALAAGCKKKDEKKAAEGGSATDTAAGEKPAEGGGGGGGGDMSVDQACDKMIGMMTAMGAAADSNKGNCDGMGAALEKVVADNKAFIEWGKSQKSDEAKEKEFEEKCGPKLTPVMEKVGPSLAGAAE